MEPKTNPLIYYKMDGHNRYYTDEEKVATIIHDLYTNIENKRSFNFLNLKTFLSSNKFQNILSTGCKTILNR